MPGYEQNDSPDETAAMLAGETASTNNAQTRTVLNKLAALPVGKPAILGTM